MSPAARRVLLAAPTLLGAATLVFSIAAGALHASQCGRWPAAAVTGFTLIGTSVPCFFLGPLRVLVFSVWLGWLPVSGAESSASLVLPAITLGLVMSVILTRLV